MAPTGPSPSEDSRRPVRHAGRWQAVAVLALLAAALVVGWCWFSGIADGVVFDSDDASRLSVAVGRHLRHAALPATLVLAVAALMARPRWWGRRVATLVACTGAAAALALTVPALVSAQHRLHPAMTAEREALQRYRAPTRTAPFVDVEVGVHSTLSATWRFPGRAALVCPRALAAVTAWSDPGSVRPGPPGGLSRTARRGPDDVTLTCLSAPAPGSPVDLLLTLRPR